MRRFESVDIGIISSSRKNRRILQLEMVFERKKKQGINLYTYPSVLLCFTVNKVSDERVSLRMEELDKVGVQDRNTRKAENCARAENPVLYSAA